MYGLASWIVAVGAAFAFVGPMASLVEAVGRLPRPLAATVGFVIVIVVVEALLSLAGHVAIRPISAAVHRSALRTLDRILGTVPAGVRSLFIVAVAILTIETLPVASEVKAAVETSHTGRVVNAQIAAFQPEIAAFTGQLGGSALLVTRIGEDQTEQLEL